MIDIQKFADSVGIARDYIDANGQYTVISPEARLATLSAMGYNVASDAALQNQIQQEEALPYKEILDPVTVIRQGERPFITIRTPGMMSDSAQLTWTLTLEDGTVYTDTVPLNEIEIADFVEVQGRPYDIRRFILPYFLPADTGLLPLGYHTFKVALNDGIVHYNSIEQSLILTPLECYVPEAMQQGRKLWGASIQLYALRSKQNWGIGDFCDLKQLVGIVHERGGEFIGLNPLHAGYPALPDPDMISPYSPSSRRWLNIIYIAVPLVPEFLSSRKAQELVNSPAFQKKLQTLRDREYVDYKAVLEIKLKVLKLAFDIKHMEDRRSNRAKQFLEFVDKGGESLLNMATYDAIQSELCDRGEHAWGWGKFPRELRDCKSQFVKSWRAKHHEQVMFYCYLQFLAHEQLQEAFMAAQDSGMVLGLYRDLAVGVSEGSCDVWSDSDKVYRGQAEVGAPPDTLGPLGQSWGLAPMEPHALWRNRYKQLIELYRSNMKSCGALRIDHAAGLYRFWWVPPQHKPTEGAYVYNNMKDWLGILALESQRNKCLIIAEDLGTIPMELRVALKEAKAYSYRLFFSERAYDRGFIAPQDYEPQSLSALTTHDMATLKGWWSAYDLKLGQELGIFTEEIAKSLLEDREDAKQRVLDSMHGLCSIGSEIPRLAKDIPEMTDELVKGLQRHMCRGSSAMFSSQIEDWIGVLKPVNVPGTFREYPNWRRKLTANLEDIDKDSFVKELTADMTKARDQASIKVR